MKKRILGVLLALVMALSVLPTMAWADAYWNENGVWNVPEGETVTIDSTVTISSGTVTISGGGTIKRGSNCTGAMIQVNGGTLVIEGSVTLDGNAGEDVTGSVIQVGPNGVVEMKSGTICNNKASHGGGVNNEGGQFTMSGGTIRDNQAVTDHGSEGTGGGIRNRNGVLIMTGGTIIGNYAGASGGGVMNYVDKTNTGFTMTGGTITGNSSEERGGGVYNRSKDGSIFEISGGPVITGNVKSGTKEGGKYVGDTPSNVGPKYDGGYQAFVTIKGALTEAADVKINVENVTYSNFVRASDAFKDSITEADVAQLKADDGRNFMLMLNTKEIVFEQYYTVKIVLGDNTTSTNQDDTVTVEVKANGSAMQEVTCTAAEGYYFPEGSSVTDVNGISGTINEARKEIKISGVPTNDVEITLPDAEEDPNYTKPEPTEPEPTEPEPTEPEPAAPEQPTPAPVPGHSGVNRRFPAKTESGTEVTSAKTFDGGVAVYAALALVSAGGMALVQRKRED